MKHIVKDESLSLRNLHKFFDCSSSAKSQIHYLEIINENADSEEETLLYVTEELLEVYKNGAQQEWVALAGDGKTYEHLSNIKCRYGKTLKKPLIFPGDWHTLKTYQEVLMKIYSSAGLESIAKAAGFAGTTLQSLLTCSNFKRTHTFILKVWEALYRVSIDVYFDEHENSEVTEEVLRLMLLLGASMTKSLESLDMEQQHFHSLNHHIHQMPVKLIRRCGDILCHVKQILF